ncbi:MAG: SDR family oxidoreductase, partial [Caldilineaceae bacterium SB0668_bin_21]|nr:SDR family oxidoreductase [Caldilineaceae bacterium SB0668_bin_21]
MPPKLLITGATGLLGSHILRAARQNWHPVGTYHRTTRRQAQYFFGNIDHGRIDLGDYSETKAMIADVQPSAVIHAAAITDLDYCEKYPDESLRINLNAATNLAALCSDEDIPFLFTSADLVFDGSNAPYAEDDPPTPINVFAEHRALAEEGILAVYADAVVARLPLLIGYSLLGRESFYRQLVAALRAGQEVTLFGDAVRSPVSAAVAAQGLLQIAGSGFEDDVNIAETDRVVGRLHLGGRDQISLFELGLLTLRILGLNEQLAVPISVLDSYAGLLQTPFLAARSANVALDSTRAYELGFDPPPGGGGGGGGGGRGGGGGGG